MAEQNVNESIDLDLFVGSKDSYKKMAEKSHVVVDEDDGDTSRSDDKQSLDKKNPNRVVLSKDTLTQIDDETMTILRRTRCVHDTEDVYMQSSLEFYDEYYNDTEASPELKRARQIRRVYRRYPDYLEAVRIRTEYIDSLIDKYGEDTFIQKMQMGMIKDWIPPIPIMSKKSDDYDMFVSGIVPMETETLPDGTVKDVLDAMNEDMDDVELVKACDVETSVAFAKFVEEEMEDSSYNRYNYSDNTIQNLAALNDVFRSWYRTDDKNVEQELFRNAPENIRKRFFGKCAYNNPGLLDRIMHGEEIEEPLPDMNQMVNDPVTGRTMTRGEFEKRQVIRFLVSSGWSESRLLNYQKVGSALERRPRKNKARKKRGGPKSMNEVSTMYGNFMNEPTGDIDPMYSDNDLLMDSLRQLMRGDALQ